LPNAVVDVDSVDSFKSRLDNFWISQDVKYDKPTLWTLPVPEIGLSMTLKVIEKLY